LYIVAIGPDAILDRIDDIFSNVYFCNSANDLASRSFLTLSSTVMPLSLANLSCSAADLVASAPN
jgi:hypothetical protein